MKLNEIIKRARKEKGMSQFKLAKVLGYSSGQFISNWERGLSYPPVDRLARIAILFDIDQEKLISKFIEEWSQSKRNEYFKAFEFHLSRVKEAN